MSSRTSSPSTVSKPNPAEQGIKSFEVESHSTDKEEDSCALTTGMREMNTGDTPNNKRKSPEEGEPPPKQVCESNSHSAMEVLSTEKDIPQTGNGGTDEVHCEKDQEKSLHPAEEKHEIQPHERVHSSGVPPPGPIQFTEITPTSVCLLWGPPDRVGGLQKFRVTCNGENRHDTDSTTLNSYNFSCLSPGKRYDFTVVTLGENDQLSQHVSATTYTEMPMPVELQVKVDTDSILASWRKPEGLDKPTYVVSLCKNTTCCLRTITTTSEQYCFPNLDLDMTYTVRVSVTFENHRQGKVATKSVKTVVPSPERLKMESMSTTSAVIKWSSPDRLHRLPHHFLVNVEGTEQTIRTHECSCNIINLKPGTDYTVNICTELEDGRRSEPVTIDVCTVVPAPEEPIMDSQTATSVKIKWNPPHELHNIPHSFRVSGNGIDMPTNACNMNIKNLKPGTEYIFSIRTKINERLSEAVFTKTQTVVPHPEKLKKVSVTATSAEIKWNSPCELHNIPHSFLVSVNGIDVPTNLCNITIPDLEPGTEYIINIVTKLNQKLSKPVALKVHTEMPIKKFHTIVIGNTQEHHLLVKQKLISQGLAEVNGVDGADFILAFCVIVSRVGTDMEAALKNIPGSKPAILVVMHHTFDPDYVIPDTSRFARGRDITVVDILFHEDKGILMSQKNKEAEHKMLEVVQTQIPVSRSGKGIWPNKNSSSTVAVCAAETQPREVSTQPASSLSSGSGKVTYFTLVSGNTLGIHERIRERILEKASLTEVPSMEHCELILAFCPIVSSVQLDIERACKRIPDSKAAILVVMHHTFNPDHVPVEGSGNAKRSNLLVVHCLFHEDQGFLKCLRNDGVVNCIITWLQENFPSSVASTAESVSIKDSFMDKFESLKSRFGW